MAKKPVLSASAQWQETSFLHFEVSQGLLLGPFLVLPWVAERNPRADVSDLGAPNNTSEAPLFFDQTLDCRKNGPWSDTSAGPVSISWVTHHFMVRHFGGQILDDFDEPLVKPGEFKRPSRSSNSSASGSPYTTRADGARCCWPARQLRRKDIHLSPMPTLSRYARCRGPRPRAAVRGAARVRGPPSRFCRNRFIMAPQVELLKTPSTGSCGCAATCLGSAGPAVVALPFHVTASAVVSAKSPCGCFEQITAVAQQRGFTRARRPDHEMTCPRGAF